MKATSSWTWVISVSDSWPLIGWMQTLEALWCLWKNIKARLTLLRDSLHGKRAWMYYSFPSEEHKRYSSDTAETGPEQERRGKRIIKSRNEGMLENTDLKSPFFTRLSFVNTLNFDFVIMEYKRAHYANVMLMELRLITVQKNSHTCHRLWNIKVKRLVAWSVVCVTGYWSRLAAWTAADVWLKSIFRH